MRRIVSLTIALAVAVAARSAACDDVQPQGWPALARAAPRCQGAGGNATCVPIAVHVALAHGEPVCTFSWLEAQLAQANHHFRDSAIEFAISAIGSLPSALRDVQTADDRDALGDQRVRGGRVDVFVVERLADLDADGIIRGVHWRHRATGARWIIVAAYASPFVLAHELGHYFGLPHTKDPASIMNKRRDPGRPDPSTWGFPRRERAIIARGLARMLRREELVPTGGSAVKR